MKLYFVLFALVFVSLPAFAWDRVMVCDGGSMILDVDSSSGNHQVVLRDPVASHFERALGFEKNQAGEIILSGLRYQQYNGSFLYNTGRVGSVSLSPRGQGWYLSAYFSGGREANWYFNDCR